MSEKIALGNMLSRSLLGDAGNQISFVIIGTVAVSVASTAALAYKELYALTPLPVVGFVLLYKVYLYLLPACDTEEYLVLKSAEAKKCVAVVVLLLLLLPSLLLLPRPRAAAAATAAATATATTTTATNTTTPAPTCTAITADSLLPLPPTPPGTPRRRSRRPPWWSCT